MSGVLVFAIFVLWFGCFGTCKSSCRFFLLLFRHFKSARRCRYLVLQWGASGVAASLVGDSLVVNI